MTYVCYIIRNEYTQFMKSYNDIKVCICGLLLNSYMKMFKNDIFENSIIKNKFNMHILT